MSELFGKKTGCSRGQGGSMHLFDREHGLVRRACSSAFSALLACNLACQRCHTTARRRLRAVSFICPLTPRLPQLGGYAFIGEGIPVGLGAAFQIAYNQRVLGNEADDRVSVNFFGDGTCNVGAWPCYARAGAGRSALAAAAAAPHHAAPQACRHRTLLQHGPG